MTLLFVINQISSPQTLPVALSVSWSLIPAGTNTFILSSPQLANFSEIQICVKFNKISIIRKKKKIQEL